MDEFKSRRNQALNKKEQIDILLHEYDSLRAELLERHTILAQAIGFAVVLFAGVAALLGNYPLYYLLILALTAVVFLIAYWRIDLDSAGVALRLNELEERINQLAGEQLLQWESRWGGLFSLGFLSRDSKVREARRTRRKKGKSRILNLIQLGPRTVVIVFFSIVALLVAAVVSMTRPHHSGAAAADLSNPPWLNATLPPDQRADMVAARMTFQEKIQLTHGLLARSILPSLPIIYRAPKRSLGGAGFVPGIPRLGIPDLQMVDGSAGIATPGALIGQTTTILPSPLALAASWDSSLGVQAGNVIGQESQAAGFNVVLGGIVNLAREPRSGRVFESLGEDPVLAGETIGPELRAIQNQHVIATIKHFALNDQETGRYGLNAIIDLRSLHESDLLAFQLGIERSGVGVVMCAYNRINDVYACENRNLLQKTLKQDWDFKGWVISDWGATHSTQGAALAGLDQEMPFDIHYGDELSKGIEAGLVPLSRLDDMVHRILRTMFAVGVIGNQSERRAVNRVAHAKVARAVAESGAVLLKNTDRQLPLDGRKLRSIAIIGSHADMAVLSGGGSSQIQPRSGNIIPSQKQDSPYFDPMLLTSEKIWLPSSPLNAIRNAAPKAVVRFASGDDVKHAVEVAAQSEVAIVFANQWRTEGADLPNLSLPDGQDALIAAVAKANPHTIVVLETGGAVLMPWLKSVSAVLEAWYPGEAGGEAIANVVFGTVNPSGKLPISFPASEVELPRAKLNVPPSDENFYDMMIKPFIFRSDPNPPEFNVHYNEGQLVGYKWFDEMRRAPLYPFGFGLSYTTFTYNTLRVTFDNELHASFLLENSGARDGAEVAQLYLSYPPEANEPPRKLIGWQKVLLRSHQHRLVKIDVSRFLLSTFDPGLNRWLTRPGTYKLSVGSSSRDMRLEGQFTIN